MTSAPTPRRRLARLPGARGLLLPGLLANLLPGALAAQGINPLLTFDFSSALHVTDNYDLDADPPGTTTYLDNKFGLSYVSETETQRLSFGTSGVLRFADYPERGRDTDFDDETVRLDYTRTGADAEISARAYYNRADIAFFDPFRLIDLDTGIDPEDLTVVSGYRETILGGITLRTGLSSPLSFSLSANTRIRNFIQTDDPGLYDTTVNSLSFGAAAMVSEVTQVFVDAALRYYTAEDAEETDRDTRSLSLGLGHELGGGLSIRGSLGYQTSSTEETDQFGNRGTTEENNGAIASLNLLQQMPNGTLGLNGSLTRNTDGARTSLSVSRTLDLSDQEQLAATAGVSKGDSSRVSFIGSLAYGHDLPRGRINAHLSQSVRSDSNDEDVQVSSARVGLSYDLTALSDLRFGLAYVKTDRLASDDDRERSQFSASYNHQLTPDWEMSGGYEFTRLDRESGRAQKNSFFLSIQHQFQARPW